ncbi:MAG TPA: serine hydrolase domain-containing protein [Thermomicrobiales bacterium]|nr:serine hydrolase domain-containing protein [Thermomicrobiales bacterium]
MAKSWNRTETWLTLIVVGVGGLLLAIAGLWVYVSATSAPLHPDAQNVPSMTDSDPSQMWADAVERGRQIMRTGLAAQNLPGLSVAVGIDGDMVWAEGFGWANLQTKVPVAPETKFRIGTASIPLTSAAVGLLLEEGRLKLDEEIQTYVPEFPKKQWAVTLGQLMAHTAGIGSDGGDEGPLFSEHCERPVEALQHFANRELRFEPGTQYRYSRYGFIAVSAAVEAIAKEPFLTFMREEIFEPLGMQHTMADSDRFTDSDSDDDADPIPGQATSYFPRFAADPRYGQDPMRPVNYSCYAGSSVFLSTPSDLVRFAMALTSGKLLQSDTVQLLQTPQRLPSGQETGYGLGWDLETVTLAGEQTRVVGHDGDLGGGIVASLMAFRERGIFVAVISNTSYADTASLALQVAEAFAQQAGRPRRK